jgi:hypothetical protein
MVDLIVAQASSLPSFAGWKPNVTIFFGPVKQKRKAHEARRCKDTQRNLSKIKLTGLIKDKLIPFSLQTFATWRLA